MKDEELVWRHCHAPPPLHAANLLAVPEQLVHVCKLLYGRGDGWETTGVVALLAHTLGRAPELYWA